MRKTLKDLARYLKSIVVSTTQEKYKILPRFESISNEGNIRKAIIDFNEFLIKLYDVLNIKGDLYDNDKKVAHEYENRTTLSVYYPFLHNVKTLLMKIGYSGELVEDNQFILCSNNIFNEKLPISKNIECLKFLTDCGILIEGIDLTDKKLLLSDIKTIKISYPINPSMLIGLKAMSIAEIELGTLDNQDIFLRCDYRVLKKDETNVLDVIKDSIKYLSNEVQEYILELHQYYIDKGLKCIIEIKGFWIFIKYTYKRKELWGVNISLNNGFQINIKAVNTHEYIDLIQNFPLYLQEIISRGYGCGRKRNGCCDGGCRGLIISLDDSFGGITNIIKMWLDTEILFL